MATLLLLPLLLQAAQLDVRTSVDRSRVAVGEEVLFTLSASGRSTAAFRADVPPIDGFALVERRERTDVIPAGGQVTRVFTLELQLRAEQVGTWTIGPVQVEHGVASAVSKNLASFNPLPSPTLSVTFVTFGTAFTFV